MAFNANEDGSAEYDYEDDVVTQQPTGTFQGQQDVWNTGLNDLYKKYYNRDITDEERLAHNGQRSNAEGLSNIEKMLQESLASGPQAEDAPAPTAPAPAPTGSTGGSTAPTAPAYTPPVYSLPDFSKMFASQEAEKAAQTEKANTLFNFLMGKAQQAKDVDPNDPVIRKQADTFAAAKTREGRRYLQELAERKGSGGNIGAETRMMAEKASQASAEHEGGIYQHELDVRRQEIMQALAQASQFLTAQQQMDLQEELATIDNMMKQASMSQQESQFGRNLAQQDRSLAQSAGQFGSSMAQRQSEFERNLAQRAYEYDNDDEYRRTYGGGE
jgi:hypothetical protein